MKNINIIKFIIMFLILNYCLPAKEIKFQKSLKLQYGSSRGKISNLIFGKKKGVNINPVALCRISPDLLCIADQLHSSLYIINNNGKVKKRIRKYKRQNLLSPVSVTADGMGGFFLSDSAHRVVLISGKNFKLKKILFYNPDVRITGISFFEGSLYCVDTMNHRILCLNRDGKVKFSFGRRGTGDGEFNYPTHIAVDDKKIYITDAMNFRIQIFTHKGVFIRKFGSMGRGGGNFSKPKGLSVDQKGRIFVCDVSFDNIQIFNKDGKFLSYFGGPGKEEDNFWMPSGIFIDIDEKIWIADTYNNRIQIYSIMENE